jgi:hypothetical protein
MQKWMADTIQELASQERRSFTWEAQVLLEEAIELRKIKERESLVKDSEGDQ